MSGKTWRVGRNLTSGRVESVWEDNGEEYSRMIAMMSRMFSEEETEAHAYLMAAAPDLLEACELVPPLLRKIRGFANDVFGGSSSLTDCLDLVIAGTEAAIARARGEG